MIRFPLLLICVFLFGIATKAQVVSIDYILGATVKQVPKYSMPKGDSIMNISMPFNSMEITDPGKLDSLRRKPIAKIILIYTSYKQEESFSQEALNRKRLEELKRKVPFLFENNLIEWQLVEQTGAKTDEDAKGYFHGFVVVFRGKKSYPVISSKEEFDMIVKVCSECVITSNDTFRDPELLTSSGKLHLDTIVFDDTIIRMKKDDIVSYYVTTTVFNWAKKNHIEDQLERFKLPMPYIRDSIAVITYTLKKKKKKNEGHYVPISKRKAASGKTYTNKGIWGRKVETYYAMDTIYKTEYHYLRQDTFYTIVDSAGRPPVIDMSCIGYGSSNDTVVMKTLNTWKDLRNTVLLEDVTGSMSPYLEQTIRWRRTTMKSTELSHFIFFNDGAFLIRSSSYFHFEDGTYSIDSHSIDSVEQCAQTAMYEYNGGDSPENNAAAIRMAMKYYPDYHILMIADNFAPIKDLNELPANCPPIDIILCGVSASGGNLQSDYVTLARKTGGNIYTIEGSLSDFLHAKDGEKVKIGKQYFIYKDGKYILTR